MAMDLFCYSLGILPSKQYTKNEVHFIELYLIYRIHLELEEIYHSNIKSYLKLIYPNTEMEKSMIEETLAKAIIHDIISSGDYDISGISLYTEIPEDILYEILYEKNTNPSAKCLRKLILLHQSVRPALYQKILQKITAAQPVT